MKWFNNGWYDDDYERGVFVSDKEYQDLMNKHYSGMGELHTDDKGYPYLAQHITTDNETIILTKEMLDNTDYQIIKALELMFLSDKDISKVRQEMRALINDLENKNNGG